LFRAGGGSINNHDSSNNDMDDPFSTQPVPVIPTKVGAAAIQQRIDSARRMRGVIDRQRNGSDSGNGIRWLPTKASRHGSAPAVRKTNAINLG